MTNLVRLNFDSCSGQCASQILQRSLLLALLSKEAQQQEQEAGPPIYGVDAESLQKTMSFIVGKLSDDRARKALGHEGRSN